MKLHNLSIYLMSLSAGLYAAFCVSMGTAFSNGKHPLLKAFLAGFAVTAGLIAYWWFCIGRWMVS